MSLADFGNAGKWVKELWTRNISEGMLIVDATAGNGHDTAFLARLVGASGHVFAFDIQKRAIENTRALLEREGLIDRVSLFCESHETLRKYVPSQIDAAVFNLGWLPGAEHICTTRVHSTRAALLSALDILKIGGFVTLCVYPGHSEGEAEKQMLLSLARELDDKLYDVWAGGYLNIQAKPPLLIAITRRKRQN